ncbi:hypothetical protein CROQUDRAFT_134261 [Cronartium quercuum f. sp. fusiforme G11]|uniref:Uncharacterized protein n=1 Tax=Cronartium quercuum f. sp. fusiforme G11 TaxID=708437 RepID=A0A9P6ND90_9BASI|nr:hypothetical protein CROQUDRAFT_134261 [Cronartium quercuum f. sp. fusiforme G11]
MYNHVNPSTSNATRRHLPEQPYASSSGTSLGQLTHLLEPTGSPSQQRRSRPLPTPPVGSPPRESIGGMLALASFERQPVTLMSNSGEPPPVPFHTRPNGRSLLLLPGSLPCEMNSRSGRPIPGSNWSSGAEEPPSYQQIHDDPVLIPMTPLAPLEALRSTPPNCNQNQSARSQRRRRLRRSSTPPPLPENAALIASLSPPEFAQRFPEWGTRYEGTSLNETHINVSAESFTRARTRSLYVPTQDPIRTEFQTEERCSPRTFQRFRRQTMYEMDSDHQSNVSPTVSRSTTIQVSIRPQLGIEEPSISRRTRNLSNLNRSRRSRSPVLIELRRVRPCSRVRKVGILIGSLCLPERPGFVRDRNEEHLIVNPWRLTDE